MSLPLSVTFENRMSTGAVLPPHMYPRTHTPWMSAREARSLAISWRSASLASAAFLACWLSVSWLILPLHSPGFIGGIKGPQRGHPHGTDKVEVPDHPPEGKRLGWLVHAVLQHQYTLQGVGEGEDITVEDVEGAELGVQGHGAVFPEGLEGG